MNAYWDASALLALVFSEPHSAQAVKARDLTRSIYGWSWLQVEVGAGCARRQTHPSQQADLARFLARTFWVDLLPADFSAVVEMNVSHRLRSADAGHLFLFRRLASADNSLTLVCFDTELCAAAHTEGLRVWSP